MGIFFDFFEMSMSRYIDISTYRNIDTARRDTDISTRPIAPPHIAPLRFISQFFLSRSTLGMRCNSRIRCRN